MRIACVGGGPAGLYLAVLARAAGHEVVVWERLPRGVAQGFGVVFWDDLLADLRASDAVFAGALEAAAFRWHDQVVHVDGRDPQVLPGDGYSIGRHRLLELLAERAERLGVELRFGTPAPDAATLAGFDVVAAADGVRSGLRRADPAFGATVEELRNPYLWLGADRALPHFAFPVRRTPHGPVWAHAYGYEATASTVVVETTAATWAAEGFDRLDGDATLRRLEALFAADLGGARLRAAPGTAGPSWTRFARVRARRWHSGRTALLGDAAHTTHFSVGSGTRLALQDAIELARRLESEPDVPSALAAYSAARIAAVRSVQAEAAASARWFEHLPRYARLPGSRFAELLERRRSPLMGRLPLPVYLGLRRAVRAAPGVARSARRVLPR